MVIAFIALTDKTVVSQDQNDRIMRSFFFACFSAAFRMFVRCLFGASKVDKMWRSQVSGTGGHQTLKHQRGCAVEGPKHPETLALARLSKHSQDGEAI